jgi:transposase InsO family protein
MLCVALPGCQVERRFREWHRQDEDNRRIASIPGVGLAARPAQVWSWDITKLKGAVKWETYQLYVIMDAFSRYVVGWMLAARESTELAEQFSADTRQKHNIAPGTLTLHADRGTSEVIAKKEPPLTRRGHVVVRLTQ